LVESAKRYDAVNRHVVELTTSGGTGRDRSIPSTSSELKQKSRPEYFHTTEQRFTISKPSSSFSTVYSLSFEIVITGLFRSREQAPEELFRRIVEYMQLSVSALAGLLKIGHHHEKLQKAA
jgi:hypothetical protein